MARAIETESSSNNTASNSIVDFLREADHFRLVIGALLVKSSQVETQHFRVHLGRKSRPFYKIWNKRLLIFSNLEAFEVIIADLMRNPGADPAKLPSAGQVNLARIVNNLSDSYHVPRRSNWG